MYKIFENIIEPDICDYLLNEIKCNSHLSKTHKQGWWMWNIWGKVKVGIVNDEEFYNEILKEKILKKIDSILDRNDYDLLWMQMTEYKNNSYLRSHKDGHLNYTISIVLTDNFIGGKTLINNEIELDIKKGTAIIFNGYSTYHGVTPVIGGIRNAINLWILPKSKNLNKLFQIDSKTLI